MVVLRLHAGDNLHDHTDRVSNIVNNHTGVGLAIAKAHHQVYGVVGSSKSSSTKIDNISSKDWAEPIKPLSHDALLTLPLKHVLGS